MTEFSFSGLVAENTGGITYFYYTQFENYYQFGVRYNLTPAYMVDPGDGSPSYLMMSVDLPNISYPAILSDGNGQDNKFTPGETIYILDNNGAQLSSATYIGSVVDSNTAATTLMLDAGGQLELFTTYASLGDLAPQIMPGWVSSFSGTVPQGFWVEDDQVQFQVNSTAALTLCFLGGTLIATPSGPVAIETLQPGDLVLTHAGEAMPVRWLARQTINRTTADPLRQLPICLRAGALGENLPQRDLFVSPEHALLVAGVLVQAGAMVNGGSIFRHTAMPASFLYYHVELADHSLVLAEGVPAETFVDNASRRNFDNWHAAPETPIREMERPRVKAWRQLPSHLRNQLAVQQAA